MTRPIVTPESFSEAYYERGVSEGLSGYTNYRWLPHYSLPFANELKRRYLGRRDGESVLDFGCAKGFLVKAFRLLNVAAFGYDISEYAVANADPKAAPYCSTKMGVGYTSLDLIVAKDVCEHIPYEFIESKMRMLRDYLFSPIARLVITVPLATAGQYRIREFELDRTHVIREDEEWWIELGNRAGLTCEEFHYNFPGAKDHWFDRCREGNGTFVFSRPAR